MYFSFCFLCLFWLLTFYQCLFFCSNRYEEEYWWYEVVVLVKKMLLTGAMCIIATGSSAQILIAILLVLFFMLLVFKTAPFVDDVDDWLSFLTSLQMLLTCKHSLICFFCTFIFLQP